jgi:hypothetical protein
MQVMDDKTPEQRRRRNLVKACQAVAVWAILGAMIWISRSAIPH